jgi:NAD-dependent SIR2 family protein deacetylase
MREKEEDFVITCYCTRCRKKVDPRWEKYKNDIMIAYCRTCNEEVNRKMIIKEN